MELTLIPIPLVIGLLSATAINYLADVLPDTRKLGSVYCRHCGSPLGVWLYAFFKKCTHCRTSRSIRSWIVLFLFPLIALLLWAFPRPNLPHFPLSMILVVYCGLVMIIDVEHRVILHPVSIIGAIFGSILGYLLWGFPSFVLGGVTGYLIMLFFYFLGVLYVRYMSRKKRLPADEAALGFGDVNLAGILGLILGWPTIIPALFIAILAGGLVSLGIVLFMLATKRYHPFTAIPYAPFLVLAALFILLR